MDNDEPYISQLINPDDKVPIMEPFEKLKIDLELAWFVFTRQLTKSYRWKSWVTMIDLKTCYECLLRNGKIYEWDTKDQATLHIRCRCAILPMDSLAANQASMLGTQGAPFWLMFMGGLPDYYITGEQARLLGWNRSHAFLVT